MEGLFMLKYLTVETGNSSFPILDKQNHKSCNTKQDRVYDVVARKCSCGSPWYPACRIRVFAPKIKDRLQKMDWRRVRHIIFTIDRENYDSPESAFDDIMQRELFSQLIHNLKRTKDIEIIDWANTLEFHGDGFPHWHMFVEVSKVFRDGQIHFSNIYPYWKTKNGKIIGNVKETFFKTEKHWKKITGYVGKTGYFEKDKRHQAELPEWAKNRKRIRKWSSQRKKKSSTDQSKETGVEKTVEKNQEIKPESEATHKKMLTYAEKLSNCGSSIILLVPTDSEEESYRYFYCHFPYKDFKSLDGEAEYIEGLGLSKKLSAKDYYNLHGRSKPIYN